MDSSTKFKLLDFLSKKLNVDKAKLKDETFLASDLELTSFEIVQLICDLEDEFDVEIPQEAFPKLTSIGKLVEYIEKNKSES